MKYKPPATVSALCRVLGATFLGHCAAAGAVNNEPAQPPRHPTKDATVTYVRADGKRIVIRTAKGGYPFRVDHPPQTPDGPLDRGASYVVGLSPNGHQIPLGPMISAEEGMKNGFYVWSDERQFDYSDVPAEDWLSRMNLVQYNGEAMIAGEFCSDWTIENPSVMTIHGHRLTDDQSHICLSADGIILRYEYRGGAVGAWTPSTTNHLWQYGQSMQAESVSFAPLSPTIFAIPAGYTQKPPVVIPGPPPPPPDANH